MAGTAVLLASPAKAFANAPETTTYGGTDLSGWETVLGDGLYVAPGNAPVSLSDIAVEHFGPSSQLGCNVDHRGIMAHNIAFKRFVTSAAKTTIHSASMDIRLPYLPSTDGGSLNAQTIEGGLFVWEGATTMLDHGTAFQWILNPWMPSFGEIWVWSSANGGSWRSGGYLEPDTNWHTVDIQLDMTHQLVSLFVDDTSVPVEYSTTPKYGWGSEVAARLQFEAISIWPGSATTWGPAHLAQARNWSWSWTPLEVA